jgi:hypothetical protein
MMMGHHKEVMQSMPSLPSKVKRLCSVEEYYYFSSPQKLLMCFTDFHDTDQHVLRMFDDRALKFQTGSATAESM